MQQISKNKVHTLLEVIVFLKSIKQKLENLEDPDIISEGIKKLLRIMAIFPCGWQGGNYPKGKLIVNEAKQ